MLLGAHVLAKIKSLADFYAVKNENLCGLDFFLREGKILVSVGGGYR